MERKSARNLHLLQLAIQERPGYAYNYYNLGLQYSVAKDFEKAMTTFEKALEVWRLEKPSEDGYVPGLFAATAFAALNLERWQRVLDAEAEASEPYKSPELMLHSGVAAWRLGKHQQAVELLQRAREDRSLIKYNLTDASTRTWRPLAMLAFVEADLEHYAEAYSLASEALSGAPANPEILFLLAHLSAKLDQPPQATLDWIRRLVNGKRDDGYKMQARRLMLDLAWARKDSELMLEALDGEVSGLSEEERIILIAERHAQLNHVDQQHQVLQEGCARFPANAQIRTTLSALLDGAGQADEALRVLGEGLDQPDPPASLYQRLAVLLARQNRLDDAANALRLAELAQVREPIGATNA
jgi:tetratricopeptide (TPR) repeat protein